MTPPEAPVAAAAGASLRAILHGRVPRLLLFARISLISGGLFLLMKIGVWAAAPNSFLLACVLFTAGTLALKALILLAHRQLIRLGMASRIAGETRLVRRAGLILIVLSVVFVITSIPVLLSDRVPEETNMWVGITIAAVGFTELTIGIIGAVAGRHDRDAAAFAVRRVNLAGALVFVVLAQAALLSALSPGDDAANGIAAAAMGSLSALLGWGMIHRSAKGLIGPGRTVERSTARTSRRRWRESPR